MEKDNINTDKDIHKSHRNRVFARLENEGLDAFYDHEILELLLFYTVPRMDTNPIAHRLINEFGSLSNVLDADVKSLMKVQGVSYKSAVLINLAPKLIRRYEMDRQRPKKPIDTFEKASKYTSALMKGENREVFYILCLDSKNCLIKAERIKEGTADEIAANPRDAVIAATRNDASKVIMAHNHPRGDLTPSLEDLACTQKTALALGAIGIPLIDHIIVSENGALSFKRQNLMEDIINSVASQINSAQSGYF